MTRRPTVLECGFLVSWKAAILNRPVGPWLQAEVPAANIAQSPEGVEAAPGYLQLSPIIATGSRSRSPLDSRVPPTGSPVCEHAGMSSNAWPILTRCAPDLTQFHAGEPERDENDMLINAATVDSDGKYGQIT